MQSQHSDVDIGLTSVGVKELSDLEDTAYQVNA
jgi:hypothetical protein